MRIGTMIVLLAVLAVCVFGFVATFEPMDATKQWVWRAVYGLGGLACIAMFAWSVRPQK